MDTLSSGRPGTETYLFTLRLWREEVGTPDAPSTEWRGQVQAVAGGQTYSFRDWAALLAYLNHLTAGLAADASAPVRLASGEDLG